MTFLKLMHRTKREISLKKTSAFNINATFGKQFLIQNSILNRQKNLQKDEFLLRCGTIHLF